MLKRFMKRIWISVLVFILSAAIREGLLAQTTNAYFIQFSDKRSE